MVKNIRYIVIDVDGTLTDSGIYYDEYGNELKKFCTRDAAAFFAAHQVGIQLIILTGRESLATTRRMQEMKADWLFQNIINKYDFLNSFMNDNGIKKDEIAYIGDDLNDLAPMSLVGFVACPADSCLEVKIRADYVSSVLGGHGVVRDAVEFILKERNEWRQAVSNTYGIGL